jgi:dynactin complex subunit
MRKEKVAINEEKLREYNAVIKVIKETVGKENIARICLANNTLREMAGYTKNFDESTFNPYVKDYLDKLSYDEHNKKVEEAKDNNDTHRLQMLSNEVMNMAGYVKSENDSNRKRVNKYAKSFVDRTLMDRELKKLYKAVSKEDKDGIDEAYKRIYQMSAYGKNPPYGVINEFAQGFVDNRLEEYKKKGIYIQRPVRVNEEYVI